MFCFVSYRFPSVLSPLEPDFVAKEVVALNTMYQHLEKTRPCAQGELVPRGLLLVC